MKGFKPNRTTKLTQIVHIEFILIMHRLLCGVYNSLADNKLIGLNSEMVVSWPKTKQIKLCPANYKFHFI